MTYPQTYPQKEKGNKGTERNKTEFPFPRQKVVKRERNGTHTFRCVP